MSKHSVRGISFYTDARKLLNALKNFSLLYVSNTFSFTPATNDMPTLHITTGTLSILTSIQCSLVIASQILQSLIFRSHSSATYVDAAYCYQLSSVVCLSVGLLVCLYVTLVSPAKRLNRSRCRLG